MNQAQAIKQELVKQAPSRMLLTNVVRGKLLKPMRIVLFGVEKIGKSTFAADAPAAIFVGAEDGTSELDVARFPEPQTWRDIIDAVQTLTTSEHDFKTLVIDTVDWAEPMCWRAVNERCGKQSIEDHGYGKGYTAALDEWRILLARLDALRSRRGMHVILLAHAWIRPFKNPTGEDYDRYELKLHAKAGGMLKEWADAVLFANYEMLTKKKGDGPLAKSRGVSTDARILYAQRSAAWDAGNRYGLPKELPFSWAEFTEAVKRGSPAELEKALADVEAMLARVDPETVTKAREWLGQGTNAKDALKLSQLADRIRGRVVISDTNDTGDDATSNDNSQSTKEESKS